MVVHDKFQDIKLRLIGQLLFDAQNFHEIGHLQIYIHLSVGAGIDIRRGDRIFIDHARPLKQNRGDLFHIFGFLNAVGRRGCL